MKVLRIPFCHFPKCPYALAISAGRCVKCEKTGKVVYDLTNDGFRALAVDGKLPCPESCPLMDE